MAKKSSRSDEEWLQLIQECRSSGMTDRVWCAEHQIAFSTFYYHVQDLRKKARDLPEPVRKGRDILQEVVPVAIIEDEISHPVNWPKVTTAVRLQMNDICVEITNNANADTIRNTLLAIGQIC